MFTSTPSSSTAHARTRPRGPCSADFQTLIRGATNLYALARPLATYLERFPNARDLPVEEFLYWAKGGVGPEPSITLHHLVIHQDSANGIYIADKQLYASRYLEASLLVLWLAAPAQGPGYYLLAGMRGRSSLLGGLTARMLRGRIEEESREYTRIYLDWLRRSLAPA